MSDEEATPMPLWKVRGLVPTLLVLFAVALLIWRPGRSPDPHLVARDEGMGPPHIPSGKPSEDALSPPSFSPEEKSGCLIPALESEPLPSKDIVYKSGVTIETTGGPVEPGLYRLKAAFSSKPEFTAGRWSMLLDLAKEGEGAYYRKLGLAPTQSRIRWRTTKDHFIFEIKCPDTGTHNFGYSVTETGFTLVAEGGFSLPFERYGDSRVALLDQTNN